MSKKKNKNLQVRLLKKQQLQLVNQGVAVVIPENPAVTVPGKDESKAVDSHEADTHKLALKTFSSGIWRTVISTIIVIILLVAAVVISYKTSYLTQVGDWLYTALKLSNT